MSLQSLMAKYKSSSKSTDSSSSVGSSSKRPREDDTSEEVKTTSSARPSEGKKDGPATAADIATAKANAKTGGFIDPCVTGTGDLAEIGRRARTDKVTHHGYHRFYPRFLEHLRPAHVSGGCGMMEIGIDNSHSLQMWLEYFPHSFIYGIDIGVDDSGDRFKIFKADQSDKAALTQIVEKKIRHDIFFIIDDGSHIPEHQILTFDYFFLSLLRAGGTYIIEDIETSYWSKNGLYGYDTRYGYEHPKSAIECFKRLVDEVNGEFLNAEAWAKHDAFFQGPNAISKETRAWVSSITFGTNCIMIAKRTQEEFDLYRGRPYRYVKNL